MNRTLSMVHNYNVQILPLSIIKVFLRVEETHDDDLMLFLLNAVVNFAEEKLGIVIGKKDYEYQTEGISTILLPKPNIISVNSVKVNGIDANFVLVGNVVQVKNTTANLTVKIHFTAENLHISDDIKLALLRHIFLMYENRSTENLPTNAVDSIYHALISNHYNI